MESSVDIYPKLFGDWHKLLDLNPYYGVLLESVLSNIDVISETETVCPDKHHVFRAFQETPLAEAKVVFLGQDPYHSIHQRKKDACGLSFITENGFIPPSLKNIWIELQSEVNDGTIEKQPHHDYDVDLYPFSNWPKEGVLMLNTSLTVTAEQPGSHASIWWPFMSNFIDVMLKEKPDLVWILLGKHAQNLLANANCLKVEAAHPSPLARGAFFGSKIFSRTNALLGEEHKIKW